VGDSGNASTTGAGGAGGRGCVGTLGSEAGRGEGVVLGGDITLGSAAGTDIGSGSKPGGTVGVLATVVGVGILAGPGSVIALKIVDSSCRAACWLSLMGESGEAGDGCKRALVKSRAAAMATSVEEDFGIETFVGNQTTVSAMRSDVVSRIQTR